MGDRDARVGRRRDPGGHARHDLERHARRRERLGLLAAAPEHERVAALEPHHALARAAELDQQLVGLLLGERRRAGLLADVAQLRIRPRPLERARRDQPVVEDRVRAAISSSERRVIRPGSPGPAPTRYTMPLTRGTLPGGHAAAPPPRAARPLPRRAAARPRPARARRGRRRRPRARRGSSASHRAARRRRSACSPAPAVTQCAPIGV